MWHQWLEKFKESFLSTLPIYVVVMVCYLLERYNVGLFGEVASISKITDQDFFGFSMCALLIAFGLGLFTIGTDQSMSQIGELVGSSLMKRRKLFLVVSMTLVLGIFVTVAEPDLAVLADQLGGMSKEAVIWTIGIGVGVFLVISVLRIIFGKNLNVMFLAFYGLIFVLAYFVDPRLLPICFDSGGVTTGPVTVPFILAFGVGVAASRQGKRTGDDSFGLTALCSVGPILSVMILSRFVDTSFLSRPYVLEEVTDSFGPVLGESVLSSMLSVLLAVAPIAVFFLLYNSIFLRLPAKKVVRILIGLIYAYVGLVALLSAVDAGFRPIAQKIGLGFGQSTEMFPIALVFAALFGLFGVLAEPAVHVLARQIEAVSEGTIRQATVLAILAISISMAVVMAILRAYYGFDIMYYLAPGYVLSLALSFIVPKIYTAIAFDSGGVASGPMTSTFVLPFCVGFAYSRIESGHRIYSGRVERVTGGEVYTNGFGLVALVAMMPLIVLQLLGLYIKVKQAMLYHRARARIVEPNDDQIIHFGEEA